MKRHGTARIKLEQMPRCPSCKSRKSVGQVKSVVLKIYGKNRSYNCCEAYYCSKCLVEWGEDGSIREPMYA